MLQMFVVHRLVGRYGALLRLVRFQLPLQEEHARFLRAERFNQRFLLVPAVVDRGRRLLQL